MPLENGPSDRETDNAPTHYRDVVEGHRGSRPLYKCATYEATSIIIRPVRSTGCRHRQVGNTLMIPSSSQSAFPASISFARRYTVVSSSQQDVCMDNNGVGSNSSLSCEQKCSSRPCARLFPCISGCDA